MPCYSAAWEGFYEPFFENTVPAARALDPPPSLSAGNISNETSRCREMPVRAHEPYFARLVRQSFRGICEQSKTPKEAHRRDAKGLLRRDVVQIVTTSLIAEEGLLEPRLPARLAAVARRRGHAAVAWPDLAEGQVGVWEIPAETLMGSLAQADPRAVVLPRSLSKDGSLLPVPR